MADYEILIVLMAIILNLVAFIVYALDKWKAKKGAWRIPESTLLTIAAFCPWGALSGMYYFRHKTRKPKFKLVWVFAAVHLIAATAIITLL